MGLFLIIDVKLVKEIFIYDGRVANESSSKTINYWNLAFFFSFLCIQIFTESNQRQRNKIPRSGAES